MPSTSLFPRIATWACFPSTLLSRSNHLSWLPRSLRIAPQPILLPERLLPFPIFLLFLAFLYRIRPLPFRRVTINALITRRTCCTRSMPPPRPRITNPLSKPAICRRMFANSPPMTFSGSSRKRLQQSRARQPRLRKVLMSWTAL